jgi:hypothetical protein
MKNIDNEKKTIKYNITETAHPNKFLKSILLRTSLPPVNVRKDVSTRSSEDLSPKYIYWGASLTEENNERIRVLLSSRLVYLYTRT